MLKTLWVLDFGVNLKDLQPIYAVDQVEAEALACQIEERTGKSRRCLTRFPHGCGGWPGTRDEQRERDSAAC